MTIERPDTELERSMPLVLLLVGGAFMWGAFMPSLYDVSGFLLSAALGLMSLGMLWILKYPAYSLRIKPDSFNRNLVDDYRGESE